MLKALTAKFESNALSDWRWIDAGVNLFSEQFSQDRLEMLERAAAQGVEQILLIASDLAEAQLNIDFCQATALQQGSTIPQLSTTAGIHPHQAANAADDWLHTLTQLCQNPWVVAVGECGLDFNRMFSPAPQQLAVFEQQLALSKQLGKPVYLHERDAFAPQLNLLQNQHIDQGIAHCFTGDSVQLRAYLDLGLYIGITGWLCDERRGQSLVEALDYLPLDRLILETDAPYLLPRNLSHKPKSRRNEPAFIQAIAERVAELKGCDVQLVAAASRRNLQQLLHKELSC